MTNTFSMLKLIGAAITLCTAAAAAAQTRWEPVPPLKNPALLNIGFVCRWQGACITKQNQAMRSSLKFVRANKPPAWKISFAIGTRHRGNRRMGRLKMHRKRASAAPFDRARYRLDGPHWRCADEWPRFAKAGGRSVSRALAECCFRSTRKLLRAFICGIDTVRNGGPKESSPDRPEPTPALRAYELGPYRGVEGACSVRRFGQQQAAL